MNIGSEAYRNVGSSTAFGFAPNVERMKSGEQFAIGEAIGYGLDYALIGSSIKNIKNIGKSIKNTIKGESELKNVEIGMRINPENKIKNVEIPNMKNRINIPKGVDIEPNIIGEIKVENITPKKNELLTRNKINEIKEPPHLESTQAKIIKSELQKDVATPKIFEIKSFDITKPTRPIPKVRTTPKFESSTAKTIKEEIKKDIATPSYEKEPKQKTQLELERRKTQLEDKEKLKELRTTSSQALIIKEEIKQDTAIPKIFEIKEKKIKTRIKEDLNEKEIQSTKSLDDIIKEIDNERKKQAYYKRTRIINSPESDELLFLKNPPMKASTTSFTNITNIFQPNLTPKLISRPIAKPKEQLSQRADVISKPLTISEGVTRQRMGIREKAIDITTPKLKSTPDIKSPTIPSLKNFVTPFNINTTSTTTTPSTTFSQLDIFNYSFKQQSSAEVNLREPKFPKPPSTIFGLPNKSIENKKGKDSLTDIFFVNTKWIVDIERNKNKGKK